MRRIRLLIAFVLTIKIIYSQQTVLLKVNFPDHCYSYMNHKYKAELVLNDTIKFKKFIDTNYIEFNVPKFLISRNGINIQVQKLSFNDVHGTICFPYITNCISKIENLTISKDTLLAKSTYSVNLKETGQMDACGSLPSIQFQYNTSEIDSAQLLFLGNETILLTKANWDSYCLSEIIRLYDSVTIIGHADIGENNPLALSLTRAENIKNYFLQFGITNDKIKVVGRGYETPKINTSKIKSLSKKEKKEISKINARVIIKLE